MNFSVFICWWWCIRPVFILQFNILFETVLKRFKMQWSTFCPEKAQTTKCYIKIVFANTGDIKEYDTGWARYQSSSRQEGQDNQSMLRDLYVGLSIHGQTISIFEYYVIWGHAGEGSIIGSEDIGYKVTQRSIWIVASRLKGCWFGFYWWGGGNRRAM